MLNIIKNRAKKAFTLAEILACLGIIGVISALTLPVLHIDTSTKHFDAAKKKAIAVGIDAWEYGVARNESASRDDFAVDKVSADTFNAFRQYFKVTSSGNGVFVDASGFRWIMDADNNRIVADINNLKSPNTVGQDQVELCPSNQSMINCVDLPVAEAE